MGSLSIRGVDEQVTTLLKQQAATAKKSVNQFVLEMLKKHLGLEKEKLYTKEYNDLDNLFGCWSEEEYRSIQNKIDSERGIDQELWK